MFALSLSNEKVWGLTPGQAKGLSVPSLHVLLLSARVFLGIQLPHSPVKVNKRDSKLTLGIRMTSTESTSWIIRPHNTEVMDGRMFQLERQTDKCVLPGKSLFLDSLLTNLP